MLSFHVKFVQTDRRTIVKQYVPDLSMRGHKNGSCERKSIQHGGGGGGKGYNIGN